MLLQHSVEPLPGRGIMGNWQSTRPVTGMEHKAWVLDTLNVPLFFDLDGFVSYANAGAHRQLGYAEGDLSGVNIAELDSALSGDMWGQVRESILTDGKLNYESHLHTRTGEVIPYEFHFQYCTDGGLSFICALANDIAGRKEVEGDILSAREEALQNAVQLQEKTRVAELALTKVNELKQKQDGDYYLTSLLLQPFQVNRLEHEQIGIEWFVSQKTHFQYKKWQAEIGGDLCLADSVTLMGRDLGFFVIADAMGKANQGACGALILATIVRTYVERTKKTSQLSRLYPERWLRLLHDELRAGFAGFDGQMMISAAVGLIDAQSRYLYYFNAEQPRPVSYLRGEATFIGPENSCCKIGMPGNEGNIMIHLHHLREDEIVIFGSDGRDDIRLKETDAINDDSSLFLSVVRDASAILENIWLETEQRGEIIDDYSLLSIQIDSESIPAVSASNQALLEYYRAHMDISAPEKILEKNPDHVQALAILSNHHMKAGAPQLSIGYLRRYADLRPEDLKALFALAWQYSRLGDYENAIDIAERVTYRCHRAHDARLRKKIMGLLAAIYTKLGNARSKVIREKIAGVG